MRVGVPSLLDEYDPGDRFYDEACEPDGHPRGHYEELMSGLEAARMEAIGAGMAAHLDSLEVRFGDGGAFAVDAIPRIIEAGDWARLEAGLAQRLRALDAFVADVYGAREIVAAGVVPERVIAGADHLEDSLQGLVPPGGTWVHVAGLDLVRDEDGAWLVLEDNLRTPSGLAYAVAAREALDRQLADAAPSRRRSAAEGFDLLAVVLASAAPEGVDEPSVVVLTDGPASSAYFEHRAIARRLALPLVTLDDLESHRGGLARRDQQGLHPVDVVYRRSNEDSLRNAQGRPTAVAQALEGPWRSGRLGVVNAFGTGVADDKLVHAYVEAMIGFYLGERPKLPSVPTYDLGDPEVRERALARIGELVFKPRTGHGGRGVLIGPHARREDRELMVAAVHARPHAYVAQETIALSRHPTMVAGSLAPRHVDLRPFVFTTGDGPVVAAGGLTRVALREGALVVNSSQAGGAKDTWVLS
jgi:uncharacterized circularly permuted ATP-grasp superfamily protein